MTCWPASTATARSAESDQSLVNALCKGYGSVANDVMNGKYGDGAARRNNLIRAGYDPDQVQNLVNNMIWR